MSVVKLTRGEWILETTGPIPTVQTGHVGLITVNCGSVSKAYARLIAAVPEMLSALRIAEAQMMLDGHAEMFGGQSSVQIAAVRAAIAKAEGRS